MRVALVTSEGRCGIAEHSLLMQQHVQAADPTIFFGIDATWLDPRAALTAWQVDPPDLVVLNYHRGLHSRWTPDIVRMIGRPCVIVMHDTYEVQPDALPWDLLDVCDALIVHEPCDLQGGGPGDVTDPDFDAQYRRAVARSKKVHYWRQGVPQPPHDRAQYAVGSSLRPYVGTCGFAFPWKGFELLCAAATLVGWGVKICSHNATAEQVADWQRRNPWLDYRAEYYDTPRMIQELAGCDATAFLYSCANSGTSGAIRLGIAAGKPLLAAEHCRQMTDLKVLGDETGIYWTPTTVDDVADQLRTLELFRFDPRIVALRERDSWIHLGRKYAALYHAVVTR